LARSQDLTFYRLAVEKVIVADLDWPRHNEVDPDRETAGAVF
jgi:hypothetical protein